MTKKVCYLITIWLLPLLLLLPYYIHYHTLYIRYTVFVSKLTKYSRHFLVKSAPSLIGWQETELMRYMHTLQKKLGADGIRLTFFSTGYLSHLVQPPQFTKFHTLSLITSPFWSVPILPNPSQLCVPRPGRIWRWTPRWFRWARAPWSWTPCRPWHPAAGPRWFLWWRDAVVDGDQTLYE